MNAGPTNDGTGMDHGLYPWSPLPHRVPLRWPDAARVALCVVINLEHYDFEPVPGAISAGNAGNRGRGPSPDVRMYSLRDYGNRIGIFRVVKVLDKYAIPATVAIDATAATNFPNLVAECRHRGWEFAGHGHSATQMITSRMSEDEERQHISSALHAVRTATGSTITGWFGPDHGESTRTPSLLAELGVQYLLDWPNDEQPYRMTVPSGDLISIPTLVELDDVYAHWYRRVSIWRWQHMVQEAFDTLYADGAHTGRVLTLSVHPWLIGQPHRIKSLDDALGYICGHAHVWKATGHEVADWFRRQDGGRDLRK